MRLYNDLMRDIGKIDQTTLDISSFGTKYKEDQFLDFKQLSPTSSVIGKPTDYHKGEFVKDVSALANTSGGCIVYGVDERDRSPSVIIPFVCDDIDELQNTLGQIIHQRIEPQLHGYEIKPISFGGNKWLLVVKVSSSFSAPHGIETPGKDYLQFFYRTSEGSNRAFTFGMLKNAFIKSGNLSDRIKLHHEKRINLISNHDTPVPVHRNGFVALHLVPLSAFQSSAIFDVNSLYNGYHALQPIHDARVGRSRHRNMDGLLVYGNKSYGAHYGYTQLCRNGTLESVDTYMLRQEHGWEGVSIVPGDLIERKLIEALTRYSALLGSIGVTAPLYCFVTIGGVKGHTVRTEKTSVMSHLMPIDRDVLLFPEFEMHQLPRDFAESSRMLKDTFDMMWQSSNVSASPNYDKEGRYLMLDRCENAA